MNLAQQTRDNYTKWSWLALQLMARMLALIRFVLGGGLVFDTTNVGVKRKNR